MVKKNVIYLLGAGASAQKTFKIGKISYPNIPLANTFDKSIDHSILRIFNDIFYKNSQFNETYQKKLRDFSIFISKHNSIDEGMRKLYLNNDISLFNEYKNMIDFVFFLLESVNCSYDPRYAQFLLTLVNNKMKLEDKIKILSWNYDNQFEHAECDVSYGNKGITLNENNFHKINGSASFFHKSDFTSTDNIKDESKIGRIIPNITDKRNLDIDFAWEESQTTSSKIHHSTRLTDFLNKCPKQDNVMVVIGYSFPYVNHEYDLQIINELNINKIYYQNKVDITEVLKERFATSYRPNPEIKFISDCERFYLPNELFLNPLNNGKSFFENLTIDNLGN